MIVRKNLATMLFDDSIADAQSKPGPLAYTLGGVEGIEGVLGIVDTGAGIVKFADDVSIFGIDPDGQQAAATTLHHGVGGVVDDVQIDLLQLMRIGDHR